MAAYIEAWLALSLVIVGLSHAAHPRLWSEFFDAIKRTGFASLMIGLYTLPTGLVILLGHNDWAWDWPVIVTIFGWAMTVKATVYLLLPRITDRMIEHAYPWKKPFNGFRLVGVGMSVLGVVLTWRAFGRLSNS